MSSFLKKIDEYKAPVMAPKSEDDSAAMSGMKTGFQKQREGIKAAKDKVKSAVAPVNRKVTGVMGRVASGLGKVKKAADMVKVIGTGEWSIDNLLDGMVKKARDQQSGKLGLFGQPGHNLVMLGKGYVDTIKSYNPEGKEQPEEKEAVGTVTKAPEESNESFISIIDNLIIEMTKEEAAALRARAEELDVPLRTKSGKLIPPSRLKGNVQRRLDRIEQDSKQKEFDFDKKETPKDEKPKEEKSKEEKPKKTPKEEKPKEDKKSGSGSKTFKPIGDKVSAKQRLTKLVSELLPDLSEEDLKGKVSYIAKNFNTVLNAILKAYGPESEFAKDEKNLPIEFEFDQETFGRISKEELEKIKKKKEEEKKKEGEKVTESYMINLILETKADDLATELGRDNAEKFVKGLEPIYPGKQIKFKEEEKKEVEVEQDILTDGTKFELVNGKDYGDDRQYTLKAQDSKVTDYLNEKGIKFITYLQKPKPRALTGGRGGQIGSNFELSMSSGGRLVSYDNDNQVISSLNIDAPYSWNSEQKAYSLSRGNSVKTGADVSKGEFAFTPGSESIYFEDPNRKYIVIVKSGTKVSEEAEKLYQLGKNIFIGQNPEKDFQPKYRKAVKDTYQKYSIIRTDDEGNYIVNIRQPLPLSPVEFNVMRDNLVATGRSQAAKFGGDSTDQEQSENEEEVVKSKFLERIEEYK